MQGKRKANKHWSILTQNASYHAYLEPRTSLPHARLFAPNQPRGAMVDIVRCLGDKGFDKAGNSEWEG